MGELYHGSKERGLTRLEPHNSTHGNYLYATRYKELAVIFSARCGDDCTYELYRENENEPWMLVERIPEGFNTMFSNSSSIYLLSGETFKDINTGFEEVVSETSVDVIDEEYCENVYEGLKIAETKGLVKIYRYPNKPLSFKQDGSDILDKWRYCKDKLHKEFTKNEFDRLVCLHPNLLEKINELAHDFNYDYHYEQQDLIDIFSNRIQRQLYDLDHEQYIDCSYISICNTFPNLKLQIDILYDYYKNYIIQNKDDMTDSVKIR